MSCNHVSSFKECYSRKCWTLWTNAASFECKNTSSREVAYLIAFLLKDILDVPYIILWNASAKNLCIHCLQCALQFLKSDCHFPFFKWRNPPNKKREHNKFRTSNLFWKGAVPGSYRVFLFPWHVARSSVAVLILVVSSLQGTPQEDEKEQCCPKAVV